LDLISAASCSKLVEAKSRPEQTVCRTGEDESNQKEDERNRRNRLRIAQGSERLRHVKAIGRTSPFSKAKLNDWRRRTAIERERRIDLHDD